MTRFEELWKWIMWVNSILAFESCFTSLCRIYFFRKMHHASMIIKEDLNLCCTHLTRACKSTWPAEYCSITSFTSYGFSASLNFLLATSNWILLMARITFFNSGVKSSIVLGCNDGYSSSKFYIAIFKFLFYHYHYHLSLFYHYHFKNFIIEIIFSSDLGWLAGY